jgi:hypothetical protein
VIFSKGNEIEWGTPVLYLRSPDGQIFDVAPAKQAPRTVAPPEAVPSTSDSQTPQIDPLYVDAWVYYSILRKRRVIPESAGYFPQLLDAIEAGDANQKQSSATASDIEQNNR